MGRPRLHVLDLGRMHMDRSLLVANWRLASRSVPNPPAEFIEFPVSAYLIEQDGRRVLYDTGCHPKAMGDGGRWPVPFQELFPWHGGEECHLPNRLETLGLGPADIDYVVLSHMHNDHAGCVEFFKRSKLIVHEDEIAASLRSYAQHNLEGPYIWADMQVWTQRRLDWELVAREQRDFALCEAVTVLNWGSGHASGMLGLLVDLPQTGKVILASDAIYCAENFAPYFRRAGVIHDTLGYDRTVRHVHRLAQSLGAQVWFGHDMEQFAGLRHSNAGFYE